jgi:hypothetical protein
MTSVRSHAVVPATELGYDARMRVVELIRATLSGVVGGALAAGALEGCAACNDPLPFDIDRIITAKQVDDMLVDALLVDDTDPGPEDLTCEDFCEAEVADFIEIHRCTFELDGYRAPSGDDTDKARAYTEVGTVQCRGLVYDECTGRRPLGHVEAADVAGDAMACSFARSAHLEAASVIAFVQLQRQLSVWGAPSSLIERCEAAARDEVRHAMIMTRFAEARGASVAAVRRSLCREDLLTVALHNAVEGCVSETWAALIAHVQAMQAHDADVRAAYASIADDETRHAQLAWDLHAWFLSRLGAEDREAVVNAQRRAIADLPIAAGAHAQRLPCELGLPDAGLAARMAQDFGRRLAAA